MTFNSCWHINKTQHNSKHSCRLVINNDYWRTAVSTVRYEGTGDVSLEVSGIFLAKLELWVLLLSILYTNEILDIDILL